MNKDYDPCTCGHIRFYHTAWKEMCIIDESGGILCLCLGFKLDNLQLVERLAKEKNLV